VPNSKQGKFFLTYCSDLRVYLCKLYKLYFQDELDRILKSLEQTLKLDHSSDMVKNLLQAVTEKLENQLKLVRTVEKKLIDKSHSDLSLLQPLQVK
jgi:hypothetical protein